MQKTSTANERHLQSFACNNQLNAAQRSTKQSTNVTTSNNAVNNNTAKPSHASHSPAVSPAFPSLTLTPDSPHSPSSQLSLTSRSQPPSPSSPFHDDRLAPSAAAVSPSDSTPAVVSLPVTPSAPRARVPLSQVVTSLTQRWSMEYLAEAESGDVDAQCLVAQMYLTGWGALKEDQAEGKRWLQRAKEGGIAGTVNKLELLYLGDRDSSGGSGAGGAVVGRRGSDEAGGYQSGYGNTPQASPSASASSLAAFPMPALPTPTSSFFASVAATISPKPSAAGAVGGPLSRSASTSLSVGAGGGRLGVPAERLAGVGSGSSSSGDEHSHHAHHHHHAHHWHMHHGRVHSGELGVSAS